MNIRVAGIQMPVSNNIDANVKMICDAIKQAGHEKADILLTPEGAVSGYRHEFNADEVQKGVQTVVNCAQMYQVGLALGTCYVENDGQCYNQIRFYKKDGTYLGYHAKTLRCGSMTLPLVGEINHYAAAELRTFHFDKGLVIGGLICNDLWANPECTPLPDPHLSQKLSEMGALVIFHAVNGGRDGSEWSQVAWQFHNSNLRMRAHAGRIWIVTVDSCAPVNLPCSAPSGILSPDGNWVCQVEPKGTQFFIHEIENIASKVSN